MSKRYLVVSDLHLCDVEDHPDGWMAYKSSRFVFDKDFAQLLSQFQDEAEPQDRLTLVLNGDIFDFDLVTACPDAAPWPVSLSERRRGLHPTAAKSAWKIECILRDHPSFVKALAEFLANGHRVVYVLGNHDRELAFSEVRQVFHQAIEQSAADQAKVLPVRSPGAEPIGYEPWFFFVAGEIYAEHGQQYDFYSSFRSVFCPMVETRQGPMLALPMGNLSNRYLMTQMGYFNPFASNYILNAFAYIWHWLRFYAFSRRSLVASWIWGSLVVIGKLLMIKKRQLILPRACHDELHTTSERTKIPEETMQALHRIQRTPIMFKLFRVVREFWIDRLLICALMVGGAVTLALVDIPLWIKLVVPLCVFPLAFLIYEWATRGEDIFSIERVVPRVARAISALLPVRVVTFGHDHVPRVLPLSRAVAFVDTGTWAPIWHPRHPEQLLYGYQNFLKLTIADDGSHSLSLDAWRSREIANGREALESVLETEEVTREGDTDEYYPPANA